MFQVVLLAALTAPAQCPPGCACSAPSAMGYGAPQCLGAPYCGCSPMMGAPMGYSVPQYIGSYGGCNGRSFSLQYGCNGGYNRPFAPAMSFASPMYGAPGSYSGYYPQAGGFGVNAPCMNCSSPGAFGVR